MCELPLAFLGAFYSDFERFMCFTVKIHLTERILSYIIIVWKNC